MDFDRGTVQHQNRLIHNVLGNPFVKNVLPNTLLAPSPEPGIHAFPRAILLRQVPPWDSCIQSVQYPIEHHPVVFSRPSSMLWLFGRQQVFRFFHCSSLISCRFILLLYDGSLLLSTFSLKTRSRVYCPLQNKSHCLTTFFSFPLAPHEQILIVFAYKILLELFVLLSLSR